MFLMSQGGKIRLTDKAFAIWMIIVTLVLPATASICFAASLVWDMPRTTIVLGVSSITAFLMGSVLNASVKRRNSDSTAYDGQILVEGSMHTLILYKGPEVLSTQKSVSFKVNHGEIPVVELDSEPEEVSQA